MKQDDQHVRFPVYVNLGNLHPNLILPVLQILVFCQSHLDVVGLHQGLQIVCGGSLLRIFVDEVSDEQLLDCDLPVCHLLVLTLKDHQIVHLECHD